MTHPGKLRHYAMEGEFAGLPYMGLTDEKGEVKGEPRPAGETAWWLEVQEYDDADDSGGVFLDRFMDTVDPAEVRAVVLAYWEHPSQDSSSGLVRALAARAARFPALRAIRVGHMTSEHCEMSWIQQTDITPLLEAFPALERLEVQGSLDLELAPLRHEHLMVLRLESGGLPGQAVRAVGDSDLPALEKLELWLGTEEYGWDGTVADLAGILSGDRLPALRDLGLQDSEIQDRVAEAVAGAPVVPRLERLDLSMGTLSDEGAEALLSGQPLTHLRELNLSHHFLTDSMTRRVEDAFAGTGVRVLLDDQQEDDDGWRYVEVGE